MKFQRPGKRRNVGELLALAEKSRDFRVRIDPLFELSIELQKDAVGVDDRCIALLDSEHLGIKRLAYRTHCRPGDTAQLDALRPDHIPVRHQAQEIIAKLRVMRRLNQHTSPAARDGERF